jgi:hypothetical protein
MSTKNSSGLYLENGFSHHDRWLGGVGPVLDHTGKFQHPQGGNNNLVTGKDVGK